MAPVRLLGLVSEVGVASPVATLSPQIAQCTGHWGEMAQPELVETRKSTLTFSTFARPSSRLVVVVSSLDRGIGGGEKGGAGGSLFKSFAAPRRM